MCLVLVGLFFAYRLYQKNLITLGDYYRQRFGRSIEVLCSAIIIFSYLGWVAAQITAWAWCSTCSRKGAMSITAGMVLGTLVVLVYTCMAACGRWPDRFCADDRHCRGPDGHCLVCCRSGRRRRQGHRPGCRRRQVPVLSQADGRHKDMVFFFAPPSP
jgi:hypothetical protein